MIAQSVAGQNSAFGTPRDINGASGAPSNPTISVQPTVAVSYNYVANGSGTRLTTTATGGLTGARWTGYVPLPPPAALPNKHATLVEQWDFNAAGNLTTGVYWQPAKASKYGLNDNFTGIHEFYPYNWKEQFAAAVTTGTAIGASLGSMPVTIRSHGGWLNGKAFKKSGAGLNGVSYQNVYYTATATYGGRTSDVISTANGKLEYTNMCQINFKLQRKAFNAATPNGNSCPAGPAADVSPETPSATVNSAYQTYVYTANVNATKAVAGPNECGIVKAASEAFGDKGGRFITHDKLPRLVKDSFEQLTTVAGGTPVKGEGTTAQGNPDYYTELNYGVTLITTEAMTTSAVTRVNLP